MGLCAGSRCNIVLTGFMGSGKSAVGSELARMTGYRLVDVDHRVERSEGMSISDIFKDRGEPAFRDAEAREVAGLGAGRNQIISTGGGVVLREDNMSTLKEGGIVVCLTSTPETAYERTRRSTHRPLLKTEDPLARIRRMMREREPYYLKYADVMVDTEGKSPYEIASEILEAVGWKS